MGLVVPKERVMLCLRMFREATGSWFTEEILLETIDPNVDNLAIAMEQFVLKHYPGWRLDSWSIFPFL